MKKQDIIITSIVLATSLSLIIQIGAKNNTQASGSGEKAVDSELLATEQQTPVKPSTASQTQTSAQTEESRQLSSNKPIKAEEKTAETLTTHIQINELQKELIKLGYLIPPDYIAAYASYSEDTLLHMADYGDMVAIHTLKQRYLAAEQLDAYRSMQEEAVLQGSIADISELHDVEFAKYASDDSREGLLKSAAYAELAGLRGSSVTVNYAISNFNENGVEFSSSELKQINLMAQEMLEQINLKRRDKGKAALEKIDDSQLISFAPNQSHSGWGVEYVSAQLD